MNRKSASKIYYFPPLYPTRIHTPKAALKARKVHFRPIDFFIINDAIPLLVALCCIVALRQRRSLLFCAFLCFKIGNLLIKETMTQASLTIEPPSACVKSSFHHISCLSKLCPWYVIQNKITHDRLSVVENFFYGMSNTTRSNQLNFIALKGGLGEITVIA